MKNKYNQIFEEVAEIINKQCNRDDKLKTICHILSDNIKYYNWVGFYLVNPEKQNELILGPFVGQPTVHIKIPFGKGICGQAAQQKNTYLVQDVTKENNYLSCSPIVKSEIVIPIMKNGELFGELDIDSHQKSPFTQNDIDMLEKICVQLAFQLF